MSFLYSAQKGIADFTHIIGTGLKYGGAGSLLIMAVVGTVAVDLVLLAYAEKKQDQFLTGFIIGSMFHSRQVDPLALLVASPITSAIAVSLSFLLGVPQVGWAILIGWTFAAVVLAIGVSIQSLAKSITPEPEEYGLASACAA